MAPSAAVRSLAAASPAPPSRRLRALGDPAYEARGEARSGVTLIERSELERAGKAWGVAAREGSEGPTAKTFCRTSALQAGARRA